MLWIIVSAFIVSFLSVWLGYKHLLYLDQITPRNLSVALLAIALVFLILQWLHRSGLFPEAVAGAFMANTYASILGFFLGAAIQQYQQKTGSGSIMYVYRSFWVDILPNAAAIGLILFGIQRTSLFSDLPFTPIRVTSGLSLVAIGLYAFTLRLVPEFRKEGLILLDRKIKWEDFITYSWFSERVIEIEYKRDDTLKSFKTMIPDDDHLIIKQILSDKLKENLENDEFDEYEEL